MLESHVAAIQLGLWGHLPRGKRSSGRRSGGMNVNIIAIWLDGKCCSGQRSKEECGRDVCGGSGV